METGYGESWLLMQMRRQVWLAQMPLLQPGKNLLLSDIIVKCDMHSSVHSSVPKQGVLELLKHDLQRLLGDPSISSKIKWLARGWCSPLQLEHRTLIKTDQWLVSTLSRGYSLLKPFFKCWRSISYACQMRCGHRTKPISLWSCMHIFAFQFLWSTDNSSVSISK